MIDIKNANEMVGYLALGSLLGIAVCVILSFFKMPLYSNGVDLGLKAFVEVFTFAAGAKAGLAISNNSEPKQ